MVDFRKFVPDMDLKMTDEEILKCKMKRVLYGATGYNRKLSDVMKIRAVIALEYPDIKDDDIEIVEVKKESNGHVRSMTGFESRYYANQIMLSCRIPSEDYLRLLHDGKIKSL